MSKKYELPESEEIKLASEPNAYENALERKATHPSFMYYDEGNEIPTFDYDDAPCQYSLDEIHNLLKKNREDYRNGKYITSDVVNQIMDSWC